MEQLDYRRMTRDMDNNNNNMTLVMTRSISGFHASWNWLTLHFDGLSRTTIVWQDITYELLNQFLQLVVLYIIKFKNVNVKDRALIAIKSPIALKVGIQDERKKNDVSWRSKESCC